MLEQSLHCLPGAYDSLEEAEETESGVNVENQIYSK